MLCGTCYSMLYEQQNRINRRDRFKLRFEHHLSSSDLQESADFVGCYLCRVLTENLSVRGINAQEYERPGAFIHASIKAFPEEEKKGLYQLDFYFAAEGPRIGNFILKQDDPLSSVDISKPVSDTTADPRVIEKAKEWITECITTHHECKVQDNSNWHPNRLLDLQPLLESNASTQQVRIVSVKGGERRPDDPHIEGPYVTLSHCWGTQEFLKLKRDTFDRFHKGLSLERLPLTFQHAAKVCRDLDIRWLWIDALCIIQEDEGLADWLEESITMEQVYANSYCNISATAAQDSSHGLFNSRDITTEWVESATVDTTGLLHGSQGHVSCTILDLSFWDKHVDNAPVNQRAWVYQERLLAPRVLHWCQNQIAFECRRLDRAESFPGGLPHFRTQSGLLINSVSHKSMDLVAAAKWLAIQEESSGRPSQSSSDRSRLQEMVHEVDAIDQTDRLLLFYELWKHWVEVYTKTNLTNHRDRLIAFSGIARMMFSRMYPEGQDEREYVAGMWRTHLAHQLLWYVNDDPDNYWQPNRYNRPNEYRAPTFSWAAVETRQGITFPVTENLTDDDKLLAEVEDVQLSYSNPDDLFGMINGGFLLLKAVPHPIELTDRAQPAHQVVQSSSFLPYLLGYPRLPWVATAIFFAPIASLYFEVGGLQYFRPRRRHLATWTLVYIASGLMWLGLNRHQVWQPRRDDEDDDGDEVGATDPTSEDRNRYAWRLVRGGRPVGQINTIVHLDSPNSKPRIFGPDAQLYCVPILKQKALVTCLLLQANRTKSSADEMSYSRIGLTQILSLTRDPLDALTTLPESRNIGPRQLDDRLQDVPKAKSKICIV